LLFLLARSRKEDLGPARYHFFFGPFRTCAFLLFFVCTLLIRMGARRISHSHLPLVSFPPRPFFRTLFHCGGVLLSGARGPVSYTYIYHDDDDETSPFCVAHSLRGRGLIRWREGFMFAHLQVFFCSRGLQN
jgi:hypothetical protein